MTKIATVQIDPPKMHKTIVTHFSLDEIREICFDLLLDFDELGPGGKSVKTRGLIEMCQRQRRLVELAESIFEYRPNLPTSEFLRNTSNDDAPFKGLLAFEEADEDIFFGREALTADVVARLQGPETANFLALVGASGSGKSSVVRAGMIPQLRRQTNWPIHLITPTSHPIQALATSLTRDSESITATATLIDDLHTESRALRLYVARLLQNSSHAKLLLLVDQFEELFTLCKDETERTAFVENLVNAMVKDSQIVLLLTLRADFYHYCLQYQPLHHLLEEQQKIVPAMNSAELRTAIELPAKKANLTFDDGLVEILLRDVGAADNHAPEPGALPLLSHALLETWRRRNLHENRLTLAGYTEAGGVQGAIAKTAESTYQQLTSDQQKIARSIFLRLTEIGDGTQITRRSVSTDELISIQVQKEVDSVIQVLTNARLLITQRAHVEVVHEALLREWPTLQGWLEIHREALILHRQLAHAAHNWFNNVNDSSYLYRGIQLHRSQELIASGIIQISKLESDFIAESTKVEDEKRDRLERESALELAERTGKMAVAMVHDVNNSVAVIPDLVDEISYKLERGRDVNAPLRNLVKVAAISGKIANRLRDFVFTGNFNPNWTKLDVIIENAIEQSLSHKPRNVLVNYTSPTNIFSVYGDAIWLELLLRNLLLNAYAATLPQNTNFVKIYARTNKENLYIYVHDNGKNIPKDEQNHVFEFGYKNSQTKSYMSQGLGLFHCMLIAQAHHGNLTLQSEPGNNIFTLILPIRKKESEKHD